MYSLKYKLLAKRNGRLYKNATSMATSKLGAEPLKYL